MSITLLSRRVKITLILTWVAFTCTFCQDKNNILEQYEKISCSYDIFSDAIVTDLIKNSKDSLSINQYNSLLVNKDIFYLAKGNRKVVIGISKTRITPSTEIEDWSSNPPKKILIKSKIYPICIETKKAYKNFIYLYCSFDVVSINVITFNSEGQNISGLRLFEGNYNYLKGAMEIVRKWTKKNGSIYLQEITDETPEQNIFIRKFTQREDGYFEEIN
jgi:hypothetical protein